MKTDNKTNTKKYINKKPLIILFAILATALVIYGAAEFLYQQNIASMRQAMDTAKQQVLVPIGGVESTKPQLIHGASVLEKPFCIDTSCPLIKATWLAPIEVGKSDDFKDSVTKAMTQVDANLHASVFGPAEFTNENPPFAAPEGTQWGVFDISVYE